MKLLTVIPYCQKDTELAEKNLCWQASLQKTYRPHSCLLVADFNVPHQAKLDMQDLAKSIYQTAETIVVRVPEAKQQVPHAANIMFASAARQIQEAFKCPWLWLEPDAIPVRTGWLNAIASAYERCPKRFMGTLVPSNGQPKVPDLYLNGVAVYPVDAFTGLKQFCTTEAAWDIASAPYTVPRSAHTELIQHHWGTKELAPTFKESPIATDPENTLGPGFIKPMTAIFHRCKDGSLIDILRKTTVDSKKDDIAPAIPIEDL